MREQARRSTTAETAGRVGLASRGFLYLVTTALVLRVAAERGGDEEADRRGALEAIGRQPMGRALLLVLAAGFTGYAVWRFLRAATAAAERGRRKEQSPGGRALDVGRGLLYLSLVVSTLELALDRDGEASGGTDERARAWSARLMESDAGRVLVIAIGVGIVVGGIVLAVRAFQRRFEEHLDVRAMRDGARAQLVALGVVGYAARGAVVCTVGAFLVHAGVTFDPSDAVGIDGALKRLAAEPWGPHALRAVAVGLAAFGCYSFVEARWRRVLED